ncbi:MAG: TRAP transporter small permease [Oscillospiraceae bacterium]
MADNNDIKQDQTSESKPRKKDAFTRVVDFLSMCCISIMVILTFVNAVLRYGFNSSLTQAEEISRFMFIWITYLGVITAWMTHDHVEVTMLTDHLKGAASLIVKIIKYIVILASMVLLSWGGIGYLMLSNYKTLATHTNWMLISSSLAISSVAIVILCVWDIVREIRNAKSRKGER